MMREDFIHEADKAIRPGRTPREGRRRLQRYLRLAEGESERLTVGRCDEMIHVWETMPRRGTSGGKVRR